MADYLTKEEIRQWRSSTEKCTLEEYAIKLGKSLEQEKETHDIVDIVMNGESVVLKHDKDNQGVPVYNRPEPQIIKPAKIPAPIKETVNEPAVEIKKEEPVEEIKPIVKASESKIIQDSKPETMPEQKVEPKANIETEKSGPETMPENITTQDITLTFKKDLTERERVVLEHLSENRGKTVFAKDLAELLGLKRDYIYKYIKNLRNKIVEDVLVNSEKGGFTLNI